VVIDARTPSGRPRISLASRLPAAAAV